MRTFSPSTRRRILALASLLDRWAARLRRYAKARTPRRNKVKDTQTEDMFRRETE